MFICSRQLFEIILIHSCLSQAKFLSNLLILRHPNIYSLLSLLFRQARGDATQDSGGSVLEIRHYFKSLTHYSYKTIMWTVDIPWYSEDARCNRMILWYILWYWTIIFHFWYLRYMTLQYSVILIIIIYLFFMEYFFLLNFQIALFHFMTVNYNGCCQKCKSTNK